ncbi:glycosyltransferase family 2 protein [Corynebacterium timonense]|uniref:N-acetylglucosaminyl-diphospho-decaprenol L-rhamnosyltransferase n=1 Tax=Corynebacterium timonense TaxID=441500 RepID=A0A1H1RTW8_9CORY|nr:glycosyltransferase family 2 protein [Corynebacterium timonense]SDS38986.1 N-acetylglucosaminyl-diphospho-decaprenol L-rhamnosyltransferase [Corynebacterium timonense]
MGKLLRIVEKDEFNDSAVAPLAVVTVTYSPGEHLGRLVDSLGAATAGPTLVVCADNGSTDGVAERLASEREGVEFLPTGGNIGYGAAINAAARRLRSLREAGTIDERYVVVTNPDVRFRPGSIDALLACAEALPSAGAVGPRIEEEDGSAYPSAREVPDLVTGAGHALLSRVWPSNPFTAAYKAGADMDTQRTAGWLSGACLLVRWEAFDEVGGFDERYFMYMEDIDFGDRLARAGWDNVFCPSAVIAHDQGHVAGRHSRVTVPAHHASAYRFQADRHPRWWQAPVRAALWCGLTLRGAIEARRG